MSSGDKESGVFLARLGVSFRAVVACGAKAPSRPEAAPPPAGKRDGWLMVFDAPE
jgi:hypothetical protein